MNVVGMFEVMIVGLDQGQNLDFECCQKVEFIKLQKCLWYDVGQVIVDFFMIEVGDKVMCCLLGGKDFYVMLDILLVLQKSVLVLFELIVVNLDQKQFGFLEEVLLYYFSEFGIEYYIIEKDIYSIVKEKVFEGKMICGLCFCLWCGILYNFVEEYGVIKIVLGYYWDDLFEMLFLNMFYGGKMKFMFLVLYSDDGWNIVIWLFVYCWEKDIVCYV